MVITMALARKKRRRRSLANSMNSDEADNKAFEWGQLTDLVMAGKFPVLCVPPLCMSACFSVKP